jgi:hypothetical protein
MKQLRQQLRQVTVILCSLLCVALAVRGFYEASLQKAGSLGSLVIGTLALGLAYAIIKQYRWALRLTAAILLVAAVILPVGVLNPFTAGDYLAAGKEAPLVTETLLWLIPFEILLLVIVFLIDPGRKKPDNDLS